MLYKHVIRGIDFLTRNPHAVLADDMGLGKTVQALRTCQKLGAKRVLIVCPKVLMHNWAMEIDKWVAPDWYKTTQVVGDFSQREELIRTVSRFTIVNYDITGTQTKWSTPGPGQKKVKIGTDPRHLPTLMNQKWDAIIVDEAHRIKNRQSKAFLAITSIVKKAKPKIVLPLTGTPLINRPEELWPLLHLIDPAQYSSFWRWVSQECRVVYDFASQRDEIVGLKDPEATKKRLSTVMLRRMKSDVLDLPPKTIINVPVDLSPGHRAAYMHLKKKLFLEWEGTLTEATNPLSLLTRLKQVAISPDLLSEGSTVLRGAKYDMLLDLLESSGNQQVVIFSQFATVIKRLYALLTPIYSATILVGDTNAGTRIEAVNKFQAGETKLFLATMQAGGVGLTLTAGSITIMTDLMFAPAYNNQAVDRIYRIGQDKPVTVYNLNAVNTVEDKILRLLAEKDAMFDSTIPVERVMHLLKGALEEED